MSFWERQTPRRTSWGSGSSYEDGHDTGRHHTPSYKPTGEDGKFDTAMSTYARNGLDTLPSGSPRNREEASRVLGKVPRRGIGGKLVMQQVTWGNPDKFPADLGHPQGAIGRASAERMLAKQATAANFVSAYARSNFEGANAAREELAGQGIDVERPPEFTVDANITPVGRALFALDYAELALQANGFTQAGIMNFQVGILEGLGQNDPELLDALNAFVEQLDPAAELQ